MLNSIKPWMTVSFDLARFVSLNGAGTPQYSVAEHLKCYPLSNAEEIVNTEGEKVTSYTQCYVDGILSISVKDKFTLGEETKKIQSIKIFYDGNTGEPDIKVVYL